VVWPSRGRALAADRDGGRSWITTVWNSWWRPSETCGGDAPRPAATTLLLRHSVEVAAAAAPCQEARAQEGT
jgi:hypothetical protein